MTVDLSKEWNSCMSRRDVETIFWFASVGFWFAFE
jgi:hypothetical protein